MMNKSNINEDDDKNNNLKKNRYQLIISRYKENIDYLLEPIFDNFDIIIYNKGDDITNDDITNKYKIINLDNVGKCDHTYLYHIIQNYKSLYDITVFLPASFYHILEKKNRGYSVMNHVLKTDKSAYPTQHDSIPIQNQDQFKNFTLDLWETTFGSNKDEAKKNDYKLLPAPVRPFGAWMDKYIPNNQCPYYMYMGIFASSKEDIHHSTMETYQQLYDQVDHHKNPEAGHYIERAWISLFYPIEKESIL